MRPRFTPYFVPALLAGLLTLNYLYLVKFGQKNIAPKTEATSYNYPELSQDYSAILGFTPQSPIKFQTMGPAKSERILSFLMSQSEKAKGNLKKLSKSREMSAFLASIKQDELLFLATLVLDSSMDQDSRRISLYVLTSSLPQSVLALVEIASMPLADDLAPSDKSFELSLRLAALLALDALPKEPKLKEAFQRIFTQADHPDLKNLALAAISSWEEKRPQRLEVLAKKISWRNQAGLGLL